jgi:peptidoglycan/xylan/chitin deacetylase (PgdA/CDA1 family)
VKVTLTFDNGPTPGITEGVLDILRQRDLRATFFVIGAKLRDPAARALAVRALGEGHRIGNHTLDHAVPLGAIDDPAEVVRQIDEAQLLLGDLGAGRLFRPYGAGGIIDERLLGPAGIDHLVRSAYTCVLWNVLPGDWRDPDGWVDAALDQVAAGSWGSDDWPVVVVHDLPVGALPRLPELLDRLDAAGAEPTLDLPESCVPIRRGRPTGSWALLG